MLCMCKAFITIIVLVVIPILPGQSFWLDHPWLLILEPTPGRVLDPPLAPLDLISCLFIGFLTVY